MTWFAAILVGLGGLGWLNRLAPPKPAIRVAERRSGPVGLGFIDVLGNLLSSDKLDLIFPPDK